ncbi:dopamine N-acetyltransferase-like isoform X2 [Cimex lectularius]|nr:dopamine N-acetyltransferase-like isoform X2 [Cimex lectularius]
MEGKGYRLEPITTRDSSQVIQFLRKFFFKDEPLNICVGLLDEPGSTCIELETYCLDSIPDGVSLMAVSPDNEMLGVCINGVLRREENDKSNDKEDDLQNCTNQKFKKILNLLTTVGKDSDVFGQFPEIDSCVEIRVVSVDDACRGQGIAKAFFDQTKKVAKEQGYPLVKVDCTSHYSAMAVSRLGFHCIYTLNYSDHLDEEGKPVFVPEPPHACVKTYVMHVN